MADRVDDDLAARGSAPLAPGTLSGRNPARVIGVDTVRARGLVRRQNKALCRHWQRQQVDPSTDVVLQHHEWSGGLLPSGAWLSVDRVGGRLEAAIELSIPRWLRGNNRSPASVAEVRTVLADAFTAAADHVDWTCEPDTLRLTRLDLVRDFDNVPEPRAVLAALEVIPADRARTEVIRDDSCQGVESLYRTARRWRLRAYDRAEAYRDQMQRARDAAERRELKQLAAQEEGKVRAELQLRGEALKELGLSGVRQLAATRLDEVGRRFIVERGRLCVPVGGARSDLLAVATRMRAGGDGKYFSDVVGYLLTEASGIAPMKHADTVRKYRRLADQYGLTASMVSGGSFGPAPGRLDFESGRFLDLSEVDLQAAA